MGCCNASALPVPMHTPGIDTEDKPHQRRARSVAELKFSTASFVFRVQERLTTNYRVVKKIGEGTFGSVWKVVHKPTGQVRAVKTLTKAVLAKEQEEEILREVEILKDLDHPNILKIFEVLEDQNSFHIITELCTGGDLLDRISSLPTVSETTIATYIHQVLSAVAYCHERSIVHRDIKPENLLLMSEKTDSLLKVIDFGTSFKFSPSSFHHCPLGTIYYMAPEVLNSVYSDKCDIWSCGVVMSLLLTKKPPFEGRTEEGIKQRIREATVEYDREEWGTVTEGAKGFVRKMLTKDPTHRASAKELLTDAWLLSHLSSLPDNPALHASVLLNLRSFRFSCKLRQAVLQLIAWQFAPLEATEPLKRVFIALDIDHDGKLSHTDLELALGSSHIEDVETIMSAIDCDQSGFIEFHEFLIAALDWKHILTPDVLKQAFQAFDKDGNGHIDLGELRRMLEGQQDVEAPVWSAIMQEVDSDGNGVIDLDEFSSMTLRFISPAQQS